MCTGDIVAGIAQDKSVKCRDRDIGIIDSFSCKQVVFERSAAFDRGWFTYGYTHGFLVKRKRTVAVHRQTDIMIVGILSRRIKNFHISVTGRAICKDIIADDRINAVLPGKVIGVERDVHQQNVVIIGHILLYKIRFCHDGTEGFAVGHTGAEYRCGNCRQCSRLDV